MYKPWIAMIESIDLSSLGNSFQTPQLSDFSTNKQSLYDNISDLLLGCQAVAGPLADEWAEVRGEALENRLEYVRQCARALETNSSHIGFSLQLLSEQVQINIQQQAEARVREEQYQREQLRRGESMPYQGQHQRTESRGIMRPPLMQSQSFAEGDPTAQTYRKGGDYAKLKKLLGEDPAPQAVVVNDTPDFLRLDYENDLSWDLKEQPAQVKGGSLLALVDQLLRGKDATARRLVQTPNLNPPQPIMPKNMKKLKFLDIDVTEFARQLTIIESRLYGKIKPTECLNKTWQKKVGEGEPEPAPNVKALILHSNQMTNWVAEMILAQTDVKKRLVVIEHCVAVADVSIFFFNNSKPGQTK